MDWIIWSKITFKRVILFKRCWTFRFQQPNRAMTFTANMSDRANSSVSTQFHRKARECRWNWRRQNRIALHSNTRRREPNWQPVLPANTGYRARVQISHQKNIRKCLVSRSSTRWGQAPTFLFWPQNGCELHISAAVFWDTCPTRRAPDPISTEIVSVLTENRNPTVQI